MKSASGLSDCETAEMDGNKYNIVYFINKNSQKRKIFVITPGWVILWGFFGADVVIQPANLALVLIGECRTIDDPGMMTPNGANIRL